MRPLSWLLRRMTRDMPYSFNPELAAQVVARLAEEAA
jgi:hypothetical protein